MASPKMTFGAAGNFHASSSLGPGAGAWEWSLDLSTKLEGHLRVSVTSGPNIGTTRGLNVEVYAYASTISTMLVVLPVNAPSVATIQTLFIPTGRWSVLFYNLDPSYAVTVEATLDTVDGIV
jgi:hypothetical protein